MKLEPPLKKEYSLFQVHDAVRRLVHEYGIRIIDGPNGYTVATPFEVCTGGEYGDLLKIAGLHMLPRQYDWKGGEIPNG